MHPDWDQDEIYGDIAILVLRRLVFIFRYITDNNSLFSNQSERWKSYVSNLQFNDWVSPICLPKKRKGQTSMVILIGRGRQPISSRVFDILRFDQKVITGEMMSIVWFLALDELKVNHSLFNYGLFFQLWIFSESLEDLIIADSGK